MRLKCIQLYNSIYHNKLLEEGSMGKRMDSNVSKVGKVLLAKTLEIWLNDPQHEARKTVATSTDYTCQFIYLEGS